MSDPTSTWNRTKLECSKYCHQSWHYGYLCTANRIPEKLFTLFVCQAALPWRMIMILRFRCKTFTQLCFTKPQHLFLENVWTLLVKCVHRSRWVIRKRSSIWERDSSLDFSFPHLTSQQQITSFFLCKETTPGSSTTASLNWLFFSYIWMKKYWENFYIHQQVQMGAQQGP